MERRIRVTRMTDEPAQGAERVIDGRLRVYYDGYWIKAYEVPADTLLAKKRLIEALTRRLFNHVEHGLNVPGARLEEARRAFERESDLQRRRVKGAMLAGALFNRAADIFTKLVEIQALGVQIQHDNALMRQCGEHLKEASALGKMVLHRSGEEGIDELWGEPFKAFAFPIDDFYKSRYVKIALAMRAIDRIGTELTATFDKIPSFTGIDALIRDFTIAAKAKCETLRTDPDIFDVWTSFVVAGERLVQFQPGQSDGDVQCAAQGRYLIECGKNLLSYITRARVPMPKSTLELLQRCAGFHASWALAPAPEQSVA